ncbi:Gfo/Idh/MocA family oxidoreductase [Parapusillimonas sp. SGNA-6]|uniref:Gfo/Idh/MocA family protein n=1 Tax=Parapedobacter sp. SGR-10 TaxID=2710879 RepID=UPI0013D2171A|nr:Gfo/Idh/MocA family oxidoreductase [Parapedobacter sp. SGR-10]NGF56689.1 Gfo/Idh/MocA family oxidoreductase [Parapedobacter sp. SGR-10]NGM89693.1 Gfo/Idh/MocA family oxidoreductase [Parapusillimonas sp. SGNA-6]
MYRFGIIGTGAIADIHIKAIQAIHNAELTGVFNRNLSKAQKFADTYHCRAFRDIEELIHCPEVDVVCICTPTGTHRDIALKVVEAGKHCLIEKPLEITFDRCQDMIKAAHDANVYLGVIFQSRFYPENRKIKEAIERGRFGNLTIGSAYVKWSRTKEYYEQAAWRGTWEWDGGGALMNQAIHAVDTLIWFMGDVVSVQAYMGNFKHHHIEVEDTVVAILKFENGALGTIECSTAIHPGSLKRIEITGTSGSATVEDVSITKWEFADISQEKTQVASDSSNKGGGVSNPMDIGFKGHQLQIEDFLTAIEEGRKPLIDGYEGAKAVRVVEAIYRSAKNKELIELN